MCVYVCVCVCVCVCVWLVKQSFGRITMLSSYKSLVPSSIILHTLFKLHAVSRLTSSNSGK